MRDLWCNRAILAYMLLILFATHSKANVIPGLWTHLSIR